VLLREGLLDARKGFCSPDYNDAPVLEGRDIRLGYDYVGPLPSPPPESPIVCYLRRGVFPDERAVLTWGGSVQWLSEDDLSQRLAESSRRLVEHFRGRLSRQGREQLKAFYEGRK